MLARTIRHEELKGGYTMGKKIIIDVCEIDVYKRQMLHNAFLYLYI